VRTLATAISTTILLPTLALTGCGATTATKPLPHIAFKSPAIQHTTLPARYTCDGHNTPPPLEWGTVPAGVTQLLLFVIGYTPEPATNTNKVSIEWAVAGLNPALHKLTAGTLPPGAYQGLNSNSKLGYSICPEKGHRVQYQFELYGLPPTTTISPDFAAASIITSLTEQHTTTPPTAYGAFAATYKR